MEIKKKKIKKGRGNNLTISDVFPDHPDVVVPVRAGLFVVEPEGMQQLVLHCAVVETTLTVQRHDLTTTLTAHVRPAAARQKQNSFYTSKTLIISARWDPDSKCNGYSRTEARQPIYSATENLMD